MLPGCRAAISRINSWFDETGRPSTSMMTSYGRKPSRAAGELRPTSCTTAPRATVNPKACWSAGVTSVHELAAGSVESSKATYGPLSAPVAVLFFMYLTALAILLGAELNAEIDRLWPLQVTAQARQEDEASERMAT